MKKSIYKMLGLAALFGALFVLWATKEATAVDLQLRIDIGPPVIVVSEPPEVVMMPDSGVYFVPDPQIDIFFYGEFWWAPRGDRWYRSSAYNGPWGIVDQRHVPAPVYHVPRNYRVIHAREQHIPYGQWKKQEKRHEKEERRESKEHRKDRGHGRD